MRNKCSDVTPCESVSLPTGSMRKNQLLDVKVNYWVNSVVRVGMLYVREFFQEAKHYSTHAGSDISPSGAINPTVFCKINQ